MRGLYLLLAAVAYAIFFATFLYLIGFVGDLPFLPVTIDRGPPAPLAVALLLDAALIALFGVQHSVMARRGFKAWWTRIVPPALERSAYVLISSLILIALFVFWRPLPTILWRGLDLIAPALWALFALGWGLVLLSTFLINHFELFGLEQVWLHWRERAAGAPRFYQPLLYKVVRHPLYVGFFIAFWATPVMTLGHLLFALGMSAYMLVAIPIEERDLVDVFGDQYRDYRTRVGMLIPRAAKKG